MMRIKTLLVDDNPDFLEEAERFLAGVPEIELLGWSLSAADALDLLRVVDLDLVLLDISMDDMDGLQATRRIKAAPDPPKVLILSMHDQPAYRAAARAAGADGYVVKPQLGSRLLPQLAALFHCQLTPGQ